MSSSGVSSKAGFIVGKLLDKGAFGQVHKATLNGETIAVKIISEEWENGLPQMMIRECAYLLQAQGKYVVQLHDIWIVKTILYIALEFAEGTLKDVKGKVDRVSIIKYLRQASKGLYEIHKKGIVHRDLKPANILIVNGCAKIGDFGSSIGAVFPAGILTPGHGTCQYKAPEVLEVLTNQIVHFPADVWSFGVVCVEMIENQMPFGTSKMDDHGLLQSVIDNITVSATDCFELTSLGYRVVTAGSIPLMKKFLWTSKKVKFFEQFFKFEPSLRIRTCDIQFCPYLQPKTLMSFVTANLRKLNIGGPPKRVTRSANKAPLMSGLSYIGRETSAIQEKILLPNTSIPELFDDGVLIPESTPSRGLVQKSAVINSPKPSQQCLQVADFESSADISLVDEREILNRANATRYWKGYRFGDSISQWPMPINSSRSLRRKGVETIKEATSVVDCNSVEHAEYPLSMGLEGLICNANYTIHLALTSLTGLRSVFAEHRICREISFYAIGLILDFAVRLPHVFRGHEHVYSAAAFWISTKLHVVGTQLQVTEIRHLFNLKNDELNQAEINLFPYLVRNYNFTAQRLRAFFFSYSLTPELRTTINQVLDFLMILSGYHKQPDACLVVAISAVFVRERKLAYAVDMKVVNRLLDVDVRDFVNDSPSLNSLATQMEFFPLLLSLRNATVYNPVPYVLTNSLYVIDL